MAHTRGLAIASALPLAAALLAGQTTVAAAELLPPDWPTIGEIISGSASPGSVDTGSASVGAELGLAPSAPAGHGQLGTGSAGTGLGLGAATGQARDPAPPPAEEPVAAQPLPGGSAEIPDLDSDDVRNACTGSVAVGGALILLGLVTGSSHGILGSSGSALGSVVVGSAATGSGLACLLWPRDLPPFPGAPLLLFPPAPALPVVAPPPVEAPPPPAPEPTPPMPNLPVVERRPPPMYLAEAEPTPDRVAWNIMQLLTIMVVAILTTVRGVTVVRRSKHAS
ncbi:hypothetical protein ACIA8C_34140 [Nocardia sp. NPDC051321]|uniref:hypothetical protein n=1 Tax=Nocardia sp. NPDC051321 TaxID=3364323 RepID=UPI00379351A0